jgi:Right handed beta helix region
MTRTIFIAAALALAVTLPTAALAMAARTFVSAAGSDSNNCANVATPCRHFQTAVNATAAGGEVVALDPANYGSFTISQAISIEGQGWSHVAPPAGGAAITINAGSTDAVSLQGLTLDGEGVGQNGIVFNTGGSLTVKTCVVRNHTNNGIVFGPNASSNLVMSDTFVANNKGGNGIAVVPSGSGTVTAVFNRVEADNNGDGILVDSTNYLGTALKATISDSVAADNSGAGLKANSNGTGFSVMMFHSVAANNGTGLIAQGNAAELRVGQSTVTGNASGWTAILSADVLSYGDNYIDGNTASQSAPPGIARK